MSATTTGAVAQSKNDIPWNKHVRQKKTPGDLAVDFVIVLLLVFTVVAVLYPCGSWSSHRSPTRMPWPAAK